jgi:hypothetical protein
MVFIVIALRDLVCWFIAVRMAVVDSAEGLDLRAHPVEFVNARMQARCLVVVVHCFVFQCLVVARSIHA